MKDNGFSWPPLVLLGFVLFFLFNLGTISTWAHWLPQRGAEAPGGCLRISAIGRNCVHRLAGEDPETAALEVSIPVCMKIGVSDTPLVPP